MHWILGLVPFLTIVTFGQGSSLLEGDINFLIRLLEEDEACHPELDSESVCNDTEQAIILGEFDGIQEKTLTKLNPEEKREVAVKAANKSPLQNINKFLGDLLLDFGIDNALLLYSEEDFAGNKSSLPVIVKHFSSLNIDSGAAFASKTDPATKDEAKGSARHKTAYVVMSYGVDLKNVFKQFGGPETSNHWFIRTSGNHETMMTMMEPLDLPLDSQAYTWQETEPGVFAISEVYKVATGSDVTIQTIGMWSVNIGGLALTKTEFWQRRRNLQGMQFMAATLEEAPFTYVSYENDKLKTVGLVQEIWKELEARSNFSIQYVLSIDGNYGGKGSDGKFNGIIGMVQRKEVDIGVASFSLSKERAGAVPFLIPFGEQITALHVKTAFGVDGSMTYIRPLTPMTWTCFLLTMLACDIAYALFRKCENWMDQDDSFDFSFSFMVAIHGMLLQGSPVEPKLLSTRMTFINFFFAGMITYFAYSAMLTSFLAVKMAVLPFSDPYSLLHKASYSVVFTEGSSTMDRIKYGSPIQREIFEQRAILATNVDAGLDLVKTTPQMGFYYPKAPLASLLKDVHCDYETVPAFDIKTPTTFYVQNDWPYRDLMNYHMAQLHESGQMDKIKAKWSIQLHRAECNALTTESMGMNAVYSIFAFLIGAFFLCLLLSIVEHIFKWFRNTNMETETDKSD